MLRQAKATLLIFTYIFSMFLLPFISGQILTLVCATIEDIQIFANLISYVFLVATTLLLFRHELAEQFRKIKSAKHFIKHAILGWCILFVASYISSIIVTLFTKSTDSSLNQQAIVNLMECRPLLMAATTVLCAPLGEEMVFRFTVMKGLLNKPWLGILISSFLFGLIHVVSGGDFIYLIQYMAMGMALGYVYYRHQNIWYSIGVHAIQNFISTLLVILMILFG